MAGRGFSLPAGAASITPADITSKVAKGELVINVRDYGAKGDGVTDDTTAIQAAINAAALGGRVLFPVGVYVFSTLLLNKSQKLVGAGWHSLRDATVAFGDSSWNNASFFGGTILRSTATSGQAILHRGSGGNNVMEGGIEDLFLIGPGSGTSVGIEIGSLAIPVVKPTYRNVGVNNFATGVAMKMINEGSFYDLTVRGCTKGLSLSEGINANTFVGLNMQYCATGLVCETGGTYPNLANTFVAPICQNVTGTGMIIRGESIVITSPYFENVPTIMQFDSAVLCAVHNPTVQGAGIKNLDITASCSNNEFHGLKTNASAFTVTNAGYGSVFAGVLVGLTDTGSNTHLIDQNNAIHQAPKMVTTHATGPSVQYGATALGARYGASGPEERRGTGSPEGAVTAPQGSTYRRTDGGSSTTIYVKESGTGNTGWAPALTASPFGMERTFNVPFTATANEKADIYFTGTQFTTFEVTLTGIFNGANASGTLRAVYSLAGSNTGTVHSNTMSYTIVQGTIGDHFTLTPASWDATNSRWKITIVHRTSSVNSVTARVAWQSSGSSYSNSVRDSIGVSAVYTTDTTTYAAPTPAGVLNVKDYGAKGDDSTNDLTALQAAVDAAGALPMGATVMLSGKHVISGMISLPSNVTLDGTRGSLRQTASLTTSVRVNNASNVRIRNVTISGLGTDWVNTSAVYGAAGVALVGTTTDVVVEGCTLTGNTGAGVYVSAATVSRFAVRNCRIVGPGSGVVTASTGQWGGGVALNNDNINDWSVTGCDISGYAQGIVSGNTKTVRISNNSIHDIPGQHGIYLASASRTVISDNVIDNPTLQGIKIQIGSTGSPDAAEIAITGNTVYSGSHPILLTNTAGGTPRLRQVTVTGNTLRSVTAVGDGINAQYVVSGVVGDNIVQDVRAGLSLTNCDELTIADNRVKNASAQGLAITTCTALAVRGNVFRDLGTANNSSTEFGISIDNAASADITVVDNKVIDTTGSMRYGLYVLAGDQATMTFRNNEFTGATDYGARLVSSSGIKEWRNNVLSGTLGQTLNFPALPVRGRDVFNVLDYGAKGDCVYVDQRVSSGTLGMAGAVPTDANTFGKGFTNAGFTTAATDNTTAFQNAWDAMMTAGAFNLLQQEVVKGYRSARPELHIPAGSYYISNGAALFSILRNSPSGSQGGMRITGAGDRNTTLYVRIPTNGATDYLFYDNNWGNQVSIEGVTIVGTTMTERFFYHTSTGNAQRWRLDRCRFQDYKDFLTIGGTVNADRWVFNSCDWTTRAAGARLFYNPSNDQALGFAFYSPSITHFAGGDVFDIGASGHIHVFGGSSELFGLNANGAAGRMVYSHGAGGYQIEPTIVFHGHKFELHDDAGLVDVDDNTVVFRDCNAPLLSNTRWANGLKHHIVARNRGRVIWEGGLLDDLYTAVSTNLTSDYSTSHKATVIVRNALLQNNDWLSTRTGFFTDATDGLTTNFVPLTGTGSGTGIGRIVVEGCSPYDAAYQSATPTNTAVNGAPYSTRSWFGRPSQPQRVAHRWGNAFAFGLPPEGSTALIKVPAGCELVRVGIVKQVAQSGIGSNSRTWKVTDGNGTVLAALTTTGTTSNVSAVSSEAFRVLSTDNDRTFTLSCDPATPASTGTGAEGYFFVDYI